MQKFFVFVNYFFADSFSFLEIKLEIVLQTLVINFTDHYTRKLLFDMSQNKKTDALKITNCSREH